MGYGIYFVSHCNSDKEFLKYLDAENAQYKNVEGSLWFPNECFDFYNEMDLVFGMRGHAQMIPFGLNTKIISLCSHDKIKWFLDDIDSIDWLIEMTEDPKTLSQRIVDKFQEVYNDKTIYERLIEQQNKLYEITLKNNEKIRDILEL